MRALRKIDMLLRSEQPLNKSIQFLTTCQSKTMEALRCLGHVKTQQPEWCIALLMTCESVPQPHHQRPISSLAALMSSSGGSSPPHSPFTVSMGDADITGDAIFPRNRVRTSWNGMGHL